jgi:hypothetical protein
MNQRSIFYHHHQQHRRISILSAIETTTRIDQRPIMPKAMIKFLSCQLGLQHKTLSFGANTIEQYDFPAYIYNYAPSITVPYQFLSVQ